MFYQPHGLGTIGSDILFWGREKSSFCLDILFDFYTKDYYM